MAARLAGGAGATLADLLTLPVVLEVAAIAGLLLLLYWTIDARRRVAIEDFADETGDPALKRAIASQSTFLVDAIARLHGDFRFVDEAIPPATVGKDRPVEVTVGVEGLGEVAEGLVREETVIRVGKVLEVPITALAKLGRWALRGSRLSVGVHRVDGRLTLIARLHGGGRSDCWRVEEADLAPIGGEARQEGAGRSRRGGDGRRVARDDRAIGLSRLHVTGAPRLTQLASGPLLYHRAARLSPIEGGSAHPSAPFD